MFPLAADKQATFTWSSEQRRGALEEKTGSLRRGEALFLFLGPQLAPDWTCRQEKENLEGELMMKTSTRSLRLH